MGTNYERLFTPLDIRYTQLRNRICMPPVVMFRWSDEAGFANEKHIEHYRRIARGGAGLVIQEATCVSPEGKLAPEQLGIWSDEHIEPLKQIVEAVHAEGAPIFIQIHHAGLLGINELNLSPSNFTALYRDREVVGTEISLEEINRVKQAFIDAARRATLIGYDGIELHAAHGYLISQFLNTRLNTRNDAYGQHPTFFLQEVFAGVREVIDDRMALGARFGCYEPTIADGIAHAQALVNMGADFLDVSRGCLDLNDDPTPSDWPYSHLIFGAMQIKNALTAENIKTPVFTVDRITSPALAEDILSRTGVDVVDIGRGMLINPEWAHDAQAGRETGECIDCAECWFRHTDKDRCPGKRRLAKLREREQA
ncbi:MAG: hypothetical protein ACOYD7_04980 [Raoultibacter sp.]